MNSCTNLFADLYVNTKLRTDEAQYLKYKDYLYARAVMEQYRTNCWDGTEIQMPHYTYNPDINEYPVGKISHPDFLKYEKTIQEFLKPHNEYLKNL